MPNRIVTTACLLASPLLIANSDPLGDDEAPLLDPLVEDAPLLSMDIAPSPLRNCTDTYETVMQERGQAEFQRAPASPDSPQMVRAVDYDIDGCDFMVTGSGIQPLPARPLEDAPLLHRAQ